MNSSTGIKSKLAVISAIEEWSAKELVVHNAASHGHALAEKELDLIALKVAAERVNSLPEDVSAIQLTIRTSAGKNELISIQINKH